ncbi:MAG: NAD-binding protein [Anaerolineae bacterium]
MKDRPGSSSLTRRGSSLTALWRRHLAPWWHDVQWVLLAVAWAVGLVLGYVGFARYYGARGEPVSGLDLLYVTLQLTSLESGAVSPPLPAQLQVARWLLPALTLYTVLRAIAGLLQEQLRLARLWTIRRHVIICGAGRKGTLLAEGFLQQGDRVVVIERDENNTHLAQLRAQGAIVLTGDASSPLMLTRAVIRRASVLISVCGDDATNATVAVRAQELYRERASGALTCIVHIVDPQLCELLSEREFDPDTPAGFRLELFNIFDRGARLMFQEVQMPDAGGEPTARDTRLLVVGLGALGRSLVVHAARDWRDRDADPEHRLRITVLDREAQDGCESLLARYPGLQAACDLVPLEMDVESAAFLRADWLYDAQHGCLIDAAYVCLDDDSLALRTGLALRRALMEADTPIVVRVTEVQGVARLLGDCDRRKGQFGNLQPFGLLDRTCTPLLVLGGTHEVLARAIHDEYLRQQQAEGETPATNPSMVPWDSLPEEKKESNRRQADHVGTKLREIGCGIAPLTDWDAAGFAFTAAEVERLARLEHERWSAEVTAEGWTRAEGPKDSERRTHPSLVSWERLPESEREKDRNTVRELPRFLARAGFQLYRAAAPCVPASTDKQGQDATQP